MAIRIGQNIASLAAQRQLGESVRLFEGSAERLATGMRINHASDDAAGLTIASSLRASSRIYTQAIRNVSDGISALQIAEGALSEISHITTRIAELSEQAANGTYSGAQRQTMNAEAQKLTEEMSRIAQTTQFNGQKLLDGSFQGVGIQVGNGSTENSRINVSLEDVLGKLQASVQADGTFSTFGTFTVGTGSQVVCCDLNGDNNPDLIQNGTRICVSLGNSDGSFNAATKYLSGAGWNGVSAIAAADLDGDGDLDLIGANWSDATVSSLMYGMGHRPDQQRACAGKSSQGTAVP